MALVVLLRGVNVGGHKTFRPSILAKELARFDVVNVGAAGNFVVRKPLSRARLRAEIARLLPFQAEVMICDGRDILRLTAEDPFVGEPSGSDVVRFVSVLAKRRQPSSAIPLNFPSSGEWGLKVIAQRDRFVFGVYRRQMKAISYLGQLDKLFGVPVTTRSWNTMVAISQILKNDKAV